MANVRRYSDVRSIVKTQVCWNGVELLTLSDTDGYKWVYKIDLENTKLDNNKNMLNNK